MTDDDLEPFAVSGAATQERDYLLRRAEDHRRLALAAAEPNIRTAHLLMQQLYEKRADHPEMIHPD